MLWKYECNIGQESRVGLTPWWPHEAWPDPKPIKFKNVPITLRDKFAAEYSQRWPPVKMCWYPGLVNSMWGTKGKGEGGTRPLVENWCWVRGGWLCSNVRGCWGRGWMEKDQVRVWKTDQNWLFLHLNFISDAGDKTWIMRFFLNMNQVNTATVSY